MVWYGMVWYGMVWHGMLWYGMVWYGMVWYGMVWYGMVWYDSEDVTVDVKMDRLHLLPRDSACRGGQCRLPVPEILRAWGRRPHPTSHAFGWGVTVCCSGDKDIPLLDLHPWGVPGAGDVGFSTPGGAGVDTVLWLDPLPRKGGGAQLMPPPPKSNRDLPMGPGGDPDPYSAKNANGISCKRDFWNQHVEEVQKSHHLPCICDKLVKLVGGERPFSMLQRQSS